MFIAPLLLLLHSAEAVEYAETLPIAVMLQEADDAVHGRVLSTDYEWGEDGLIYTRITMATLDRLSENYQSRTVSFLVPAGQMKDLVLTIPGSPVFEVGNEYLVFLDGDYLLGMGQGVFEVDGPAARRFLEPTKKSVPVQHILGSPREARGCASERLIASYEDGWSLRRNTMLRLAKGDMRAVEVSLYAGIQYSVGICGDGKTDGLSLEIVDARNQTIGDLGLEEVVDFTVPETGRYWILAHNENLSEGWMSAVDISLRYR